MSSDSQDESLAHEASRKATLELVGLVFTVVTIVVVKQLHSPDGMRTAKMWAARKIQRAAHRVERQAEQWYLEECWE